ncbi:hypothetical protein DFQ14_10114 [Halopolyspora algeriensis]|uniref:Uncharacterized protein n=1 Tax=Halopolyspora algeriensis TaxID=1500506 RepID=A0A368VWU7_9ACTN|nr:hypothetical protein [Halopolyspora algeriensis]RCW46678.1 hypothetical protein DFQ14_10114 [Halopolyspora algeriensis]TQM46703.1 hypothetical protein FHU43_3824 [Halopolyspora algeriensis]
MDSDFPGRGRTHGRRRPLDAAELIDHRTGPVRKAPTDAGTGRHARQPGTSGEHDTATLPQPPSPPRALHVTGVLLTVLALCGGTATTSLILQRSSTNSPARPAVRAEPITGAQALRPDLLHSVRLPLAAERHSGRESGSLRLDDLLGRSHPEPGSAHGLGQANPLAGTPRSAALLVTEFHRLLGTDPGRAMGLVSPELLATQRTDVVQAWHALDSVRTQGTRPRRDGSVVATLTAEHPDGRRVVLRHLFTVNMGTSPYITGIELLAAKHT